MRRYSSIALAIFGALWACLRAGKYFILVAGSYRGMAGQCILSARDAGFRLNRRFNIPRNAENGCFWEHVLFFQK